MYLHKMKRCLVIFCLYILHTIGLSAKGKIPFAKIFKRFEDTTIRKVDTTKRIKITKVVLSPPPNAHYFGEGYGLRSLTEIDHERTDTIKIKENIRDYQLMDKEILMYFGDNYPSQKLTVVLKGQAKLYLDAILKIQFKGKDTLNVLNGKKLLCIGKVSRFKGKLRIIITNPNLFAIVD